MSSSGPEASAGRSKVGGITGMWASTRVSCTFTSSPPRIPFELPPVSPRVHFEFMSISLRAHSRFTSISFRFHFEFTSRLPIPISILVPFWSSLTAAEPFKTTKRTQNNRVKETKVCAIVFYDFRQESCDRLQKGGTPPLAT